MCLSLSCEGDTAFLQLFPVLQETVDQLMQNFGVTSRRHDQRSPQLDDLRINVRKSANAVYSAIGTIIRQPTMKKMTCYFFQQSSNFDKNRLPAFALKSVPKSNGVENCFVRRTYRQVLLL